MGTVVYLSKKSSGPDGASEWLTRIDAIMLTLTVATNGIGVAESTGEGLVRCIDALQRGLEAIDSIQGLLANSDDHEELQRRAESVTSRLRTGRN